MQPPNDVRHFIHKSRFTRALISTATGGPLAGAATFVAPRAPTAGRRPRNGAARHRAHGHTGQSPFHDFTTPSGLAAGAPAGTPSVFRPMPTAPTVRRPPPRTVTARPSATSAAQKAVGRAAKFTFEDVVSEAACLFGKRRDPITGKCEWFIGSKPGIDDPVQRFEVGGAVMGRYGAGYMPGSQIVDRAICLPGDVVGNDGICYPKRSLSNRERAWPAGRRPLLTGGDMRAISTAARAGRRLEGATKRLQKIGLMKKPPPRRKLISGPTQHHHHD